MLYPKTCGVGLSRTQKSAKSIFPFFMSEHNRWFCIYLFIFFLNLLINICYYRFCNRECKIKLKWIEIEIAAPRYSHCRITADSHYYILLWNWRYFDAVPTTEPKWTNTYRWCQQITKIFFQLMRQKVQGLDGLINYAWINMFHDPCTSIITDCISFSLITRVSSVSHR